MKTPLIIACLLLLIATATMPYGYYQFLRITITVVTGIYAYDLYQKKQNNMQLRNYTMIPMKSVIKIL